MAKKEPPAELPNGFIYREDFLTEQEERELVNVFSSLEFKGFEYKGFLAKRRVIAYRWTYDFNANTLSRASDIPGFLLPIRERAATCADLAPEDLEEALLTEYSPGAPINWHRYLPMFEKVIGISLRNSCIMKLKTVNKDATAVSIVLQPRSLYIMQGAARWKYQHSIPPVKELRYSITFRTLRNPSL